MIQEIQNYVKRLSVLVEDGNNYLKSRQSHQTQSTVYCSPQFIQQSAMRSCVFNRKEGGLKRIGATEE